MRPIRLTKREYEVLARLALTNIEIGDEFGISECGVRFHVRSLMLKLNARTRTEIVIKAIRQNLISIYNFIL